MALRPVILSLLRTGYDPAWAVRALAGGVLLNSAKAAAVVADVG